MIRRSHYEDLHKLLERNPRDRAMRVDRSTLEGVLRELDALAMRLVRRERDDAARTMPSESPASVVPSVGVNESSRTPGGTDPLPL